MDEGEGTKEECCCRASKTLPEVLEVNKRWNKDYFKLLEKYDDLKERYDRKTEGFRYRQRSEDKIYVPTSSLSDSAINGACKPDEDNIEVLKQQLVVYKEDFIQEQHDNKELQSENQTLRGKLRDLSNEMSILKQRKDAYKRQYEQVHREKMHIVEELKRLSLDTPSTSTFLARDR